MKGTPYFTLKIKRNESRSWSGAGQGAGKDFLLGLYPVNIRASLSCDINVIGLGFQLMAVPTNPAACRLGLLIAPRSLSRALQPGAKRSNHGTGRSLSHITKERGCV